MRTILPLMLLLAFASSCKNIIEQKVTNVTVQFDSLKYTSYADSIICDMLIKNDNKDDSWKEQCLKSLKRTQLVDSLFADIYAGKLKVEDYETGKILSVDEVEKIEKTEGYSRDIVSKFLFNEQWLYDTQNHTFIKKVNSITIGFELYDDAGNVRGHRAMFKILL